MRYFLGEFKRKRNMEKTANQIKLTSCTLKFDKEEVFNNDDDNNNESSSKKEYTKKGLSDTRKDFYYKIMTTTPSSYQADETTTTNYDYLNLYRDILIKEEKIGQKYSTNEQAIRLHLGMYSTEKYYRKLYTATQSPLIKMKINRMEKFHADLVRFCLNLTHDLYWEDDITGELTGIPLNRALYRALNICDMVKALYDEAVDEEFEIPQNIKDTIGDITMA